MVQFNVQCSIMTPTYQFSIPLIRAHTGRNNKQRGGIILVFNQFQFIVMCAEERFLEIEFIRRSLTKKINKTSLLSQKSPEIYLVKIRPRVCGQLVKNESGLFQSIDLLEYKIDGGTFGPRRYDINFSHCFTP